MKWFSIFTTRMPKNRQGFTLLELLLAISIMAIVSTVTFMTFYASLNAWKRGTAMADSLNYGDYVMEQLIMGLRSAYYPDSKGGSPDYGFWQQDNGDDAYSGDVISWVKLGGALVGDDAPLAGSPHRVQFYVDQDDEGRSAVAVKAWRLLDQPDDFDPEELEPVYISRKIIGFNCKTAYRLVDEEVEWLDEWEKTNRIPTVVELTLYLEPAEKDGEPVELKRIIGIPVGPLCW